MQSLTIGTEVQILDGSEWHGKAGLIEDFDYDTEDYKGQPIPRIKTIHRPLEYYYVYPQLRKYIKIL